MLIKQLGSPKNALWDIMLRSTDSESVQTTFSNAQNQNDLHSWLRLYAIKEEKQGQEPYDFIHMLDIKQKATIEQIKWTFTNKKKPSWMQTSE